jgi:hypothetical protein
LIGGQWRWCGEIGEREGLAEKEGDRVPRAPLSPRVQTEDDKRKKSLQNLWTSKRRSPAGFPPPLVGLKKKEGREKRFGKADACMAEFQNSNLNVSPFEKSLKTHQLGFPRLPDVNNKLWPKFDNF